MGKIKQSFCYPLYHGEQSLDELVGSAAEIGYAAIELCDAAARRSTTSANSRRSTASSSPACAGTTHYRTA